MSTPTVSAHYFFGTALVFVYAVSFVLMQTYFAASLLETHIISLSVASFVLCGYDKNAARATQLRVPEIVLWISALLGGTPGLLLGMSVFRHKTKKPIFLIYLLLIVLVQVLLLRSLRP